MAQFDPLLGRIKTVDEKTVEKIVERHMGGGAAAVASSSCVIKAHDAVSDDTAPGKIVGMYTLTADNAWYAYPGGAAYDLQLPASIGDWVLVRVSGFGGYTAVGDPSDIGVHGYGVSSIDAGGAAVQSIFGSTGVTTTFGITVHMHNNGEGGFTLVGERQVIAADLIGGNITLRVFYIAFELGVGGGTINLWADELRNFRFEAEIRSYP